METGFTIEEDIRLLLDSGADDEAVCDAYDRLLTSLNGPTASMHRLTAAAFVCARRPHIAERILQFPVQLFVEHGIDRAEAIIEIGEYLSHAEGRPAEIAGSDGVRWLRENLPRLKALLERLVEVERAIRSGQNPRPAV